MPLVVGREAGAGQLIRHWRRARGRSQMDLALAAGISARHMSFIETGRSRPGAETLGRLATALEIPGREENVLFDAAGYARRHRPTEFHGPELEHVRSVLRFILDRHVPNSALVFDRDWEIVMANSVHHRLVEFLTDGRALDPAIQGNLLRLTFHPSGLRPHIANWDAVGPTLLKRVQREVDEAPSAMGLAALLDEVASYAPMPRPRASEGIPHDLLLPVHLRKGPLDIQLFSVLSTIGSAIDLTLQELRIESFFPADVESERALKVLLAGISLEFPGE